MILALILAASVTLAWDPSQDAASYRVYVGAQSLIAGNPPLMHYDVTNATQLQVDGLEFGRQYFFAATALSAGGLESTYSNEITYTPVVTPPPPINIFGNDVPKVPDGGIDSPVELGVMFRSSVAGQVVGLRFYKSALNAAPHTGRLWDATGIPLATVIWIGETASGWQEALLGTPVPIQAGATCVASYHCDLGHYSCDTEAFSAGPLVRGSFEVLQNGGVYAYGVTPAFPSSTWRGSNYYVDVIFQTTSVP